jgi:ParB family chromosome partitioning protein
MSRRGGKWSADQLNAALAVDDEELSALTRWAPLATEIIARAPVDRISPSPFQPKGRPSARAFESARQAIAGAGGVGALTDEQGAALLQGLDGEARALVELAGDIAEHGVESPLEVRRVGERLELLSGHRRLAAAMLAGLTEAPVVDRGTLPDHVAAAIVYRRNLLRKDFTAWQEAVSFHAIQQNRKAAGLPDSVRAVARALGSSHGRAGDLLGIARAFPAALLRVLADDPEVAEAALARLSFRTLRELAGVPTDGERLARAREVTGLAEAAREKEAAPSAERVDRRGGGFTLTVRKSPDRMSASEAASALNLLETEAARLRARLQALSNGGR